MNNSTNWICSQFSGREKYAIPRALHSKKKLKAFYTDMWFRPGAWAEKINARTKGRYHVDLGDFPVTQFNNFFALQKMTGYFRKGSYIPDVAYDMLVAKALEKNDMLESINFFSYSYTSRLTFKKAKTLGYKTFLGQINPGPAESDIVVQEFKRYKNGRYKPAEPDAHYWDRWREEVSYADKIIVNSEWSKDLLEKEGLSKKRCVIIPLAYDHRLTVQDTRVFRKNFDVKQPLKLLYLGGVGIRKGFHILIEAMRSLLSEPVQLVVVGPLKGPADLLKDLPANVSYKGAALPYEVELFYRSADVFIFPTLSDGFGLTQLEAQSYKLPVITSVHCAQVITHNHNGIVLNEVTGDAIIEAVLGIVNEPLLLEKFSGNSVSMTDYSLEKLAHNLMSLSE